ncbi:hypothetical protein GCM10019993_15280 [Enterococcus pseudoavium]
MHEYVFLLCLKVLSINGENVSSENYNLKGVNKNEKNYYSHRLFTINNISNLFKNRNGSSR